MGKSRQASPAASIEVRGARQNNLKGIDLDIPLGKLNVITGPSGSGKSSLAFQTLYAEGQRRYVETFSPYVRQFFDRMDKPQVDEIRGIPPAIAIEQQNNVRTTRSTVGTLTEINDYLKLFFPRVAAAFCPECGAAVRPETPKSVADAAFAMAAEGGGPSLLVAFGVPAPPKTTPPEFFEFLQGQGYLRVWLYGKLYRTDDPAAYGRKTLPAMVTVVQDRVRIEPDQSSRLLEAIEAAFNLGKGQLMLIDPDGSGEPQAFSKGWHCAACDIAIRPPTPGLFTFNNPLGACPECRGFGRTIGIDLERAVPDRTKSLAGGAVKAFQGDRYSECQDDLIRGARRRGIDEDTPFDELGEADQEWVFEGEKGDPESLWQQGRWYGVRGFFDWLESKAYKMHVRVFLSRFRSYTKCRKCKGQRLQPEALNFKVDGRTLPDWQRLPVDVLAPLVAELPLPPGDATAEMLQREILSRLGYLDRVGLGYLDLDRSTRSLSGGELQRVNLTTCLGASLTNTLFVLDEPSIGLHPRDTGRLLEVMRGLRDKGNTLLVVEHEEAVIRAADHLIDIGPGRGDGGGELVFAGAPDAVASAKSGSLTADYLLGDKSIAVPKQRRPPKRGFALTVRGAAQNNLKKIDAEIPLGLFCCVTGVSGSGKSTLVHEVLYRNLMRMRGEPTDEEPGRCKGIDGADQIYDLVLVDQSPLARTPRSTPAVYTGAFDLIRKLFADTSAAKESGLTPGFFSFNAGAGRCERCWGNGFEKVEMQFLSDVYVRCPECEGKRYQPAALEILLDGNSIHEVLEMTVASAIGFFTALGDTKAERVAENLAVLEEVGLGYLRLGQPLNTLSGGESQRLKIVGHLLGVGTGRPNLIVRPGEKRTNLLIFDEPTTGLHFDDIAMLLRAFEKLVERGNSLLVIEHNTDVIKCADWVIDLGPEAGAKGGDIIAEGTPEQIAASPGSHTGRFLKSSLLAGAPGKGSGKGKAKAGAKAKRGAVVVDFPDQNIAIAAEDPVLYRAERPEAIQIRGAREHNLKNIDIAIPRDEFVVVTGLSGSGKSTLAFDIVFAEGQRRFLDSMSTYARQFAEQLEKPDIDLVSGLPPTVAIEQRISRGGGKSTVATVTEVYHFLRLLFSKVGTQFCPDCAVPVEKQSVSAITTAVQAAAKRGDVKVLAPVIKARKGYHTEVAAWAERQGFAELLVDGKFRPSAGFERLARFKEHTIDAVVAAFSKSRAALPDVRAAVEQALKIGKGMLKIYDKDSKLTVLSARMSCPSCARSFEELDPRLFSYNSPHGWCPSCRGYGVVLKRRGDLLDRDANNSLLESELIEERRMDWQEEADLVACEVCRGDRLNEIARNVAVHGWSIGDLSQLGCGAAREEIAKFSFEGTEALIARDILAEIDQRLKFMQEVGLGYLQLDRSAKTLSGGESQRIRLAAQLGSNLRGVLYVLDEPTIGLHPRDNDALLDTLAALRQKGNSLLVVEHDEETMRRADTVIDLGPAAGRFGGEVVYAGKAEALLGGDAAARHPESPTARAFAQPLPHPVRGERRKLPGKTSKDGWLRIFGASANNLKDIDAKIPLGCLTAISGISGSGKSSLMRGVIKPAVETALTKGKGRGRAKTVPAGAPYRRISGAEGFTHVYEVDQSPIGKTSRSTPATYVKVFDLIRALFAGLPAARMRGYTASRFSFNTEGGRCEACKGNGVIKLEMAFLPTSYVECEECAGLRYNAPTLEIEYNGKNIGEIMAMSIDEAAGFFSAHSKIAAVLDLLCDTGLGYLQLGQPSPTLSGGEAQRIKLVTQLARGSGRAQRARLKNPNQPMGHLFLIEEPTIGLHMADVARLIDVLHRLVDDGHTVAVIEHNLDIIREADYLIDIGPEAGDEGGEIVAEGTPEQVAKVKASRTGAFLR
ncbi:MAG: excinuclease ABC subunit UvrA [Verrucomicrobiales bacterium]